MTIIVFIIVLAILILVHEAGHFFAAKWSGMRVDEFGLGFPPRAFGYTPDGSETTYSLNWLPFGGFVQIFGENLEAVDDDHPDKDRAFSQQSVGKQALVLVAGVLMNILLAYLLLSLSFMIGKTVLQEKGEELSNSRVVVTRTLPESPADEAGLGSGSQLLRVSAGTTTLSNEAITPTSVQNLVQTATSTPVVVTTRLGEKTTTATITPDVATSGPRIGVVMAQVGTLTVGPKEAFVRGAQTTVNLTVRTVAGFYNLIRSALTGDGSLQQVSGPVGIADLVGDAADRGTAPLFSFVALISINLAILNLLPFPALDGGRIVFVLWEVVSGRRVPPQVSKWANGVGLALLLLFMIIITYKDILDLL